MIRADNGDLVAEYAKYEEVKSLTLGELSKAIKKINNNKASSNDNIAVELIECRDPRLTVAMKKLMCAIFDKGSIPTKWKEVMVIPIYKKGDGTDNKNYTSLLRLPSLIGGKTDSARGRDNRRLSVRVSEQQINKRSNVYI